MRPALEDVSVSEKSWITENQMAATFAHHPPNPHFATHSVIIHGCLPLVSVSCLLQMQCSYTDVFGINVAVHFCTVKLQFAVKDVLRKNNEMKLSKERQNR